MTKAINIKEAWPIVAAGAAVLLCIHRKKGKVGGVGDLKSQQLQIILENNPADDDYHTWIRDINDIHYYDEVCTDEGLFSFAPDYTEQDAIKALKQKRLRVYSSYPIEPGVFVTPSYMEAASYAGNGKVYDKMVALDDVAWIDTLEGQYAPVQILESDYDGALITTTDGWHAVKFRVSRDGVVFVEILKKIGDEWRFWFEAGTHKTIESAKRAAKMALSEEGYILSDSDLSKI